MNRNARAGIGLDTAMLLALMAVGCSSSNNASGSGGATMNGSGGSVGTGLGGMGAGGSVGTAGAGGASVPLSLVCAATVRNKGTCTTSTDMPCANACGPAKAGFKNCNCFSDVWDCPKCEYVAADYSCYRLPVPVVACPADPTDPTTLMLIASGAACTAPPCTPCGSASLVSYRDSVNTPKTGYCVCVPGNIPGDSSKWSCASVSEWPPQQ